MLRSKYIPQKFEIKNLHIQNNEHRSVHDSRYAKRIQSLTSLQIESADRSIIRDGSALVGPLFDFVEEKIREGREQCLLVHKRHTEEVRRLDDQALSLELRDQTWPRRFESGV